MSERNPREPRKPLNMGTFYHIVAGSIYLFAAFMLYTNSPEGWNEGLVHGVAIVAALYGVFRIGRGVMNILKK